MISLGIMTVTQLSLNFTEVIEEFPIVVRRRIFDEIKAVCKGETMWRDSNENRPFHISRTGCYVSY